MRKIHRFLSVALSLALAMALAAPAFASTIESSYYDKFVEDRVGLRLQMDQDVILTELPWTLEYSEIDGYVLGIPIYYVPVGTVIEAASVSEGASKYGYSDWDVNELRVGYDYLANGDTDGETWVSDDEFAILFNMPDYHFGSKISLPFTLTQEGYYLLYTGVGMAYARVHAVAPGGSYWETVLAKPNGLESKLKIINSGKTTVTYQGQQIFLYSTTHDRYYLDWSLALAHEEGASYVINRIPVENNNGTLTRTGDIVTHEFTGEDHALYVITDWEDNVDILLVEIIENGVTLQTVALARDSSSAPAETEQPSAPAETEQPSAPAETEQPSTPAETEQPSAPAPDAPGSYTVQAGDTWSSICTNFYGNNAQRYALMKANGNVGLKVGAVITLPEQLGNVTRLPAPVAGAGETLYTVKLGDTLGSIALAEYGTMSAYKDIFDRNADRIKNVNLIYEGQVIVLPAK